MAFKPNYRQQRSERQRAERARNEEKQKKLEDKVAERKALREARENAGTDEPQA